MPPKGKRFTSEYQPENRGRKPNKLKDLIKESQFTTQDIRAIFANIVSVNTLDEMKEMILDKNTDFMVAAYLKAMVKDYQNSKTDTMDKLIEYAFGKTKTIIETTSENRNTNLNIDGLSKEEKQEILTRGLQIFERERKERINEKEKDQSKD